MVLNIETEWQFSLGDWVRNVQFIECLTSKWVCEVRVYNSYA